MWWPLAHVYVISFLGGSLLIAAKVEEYHGYYERWWREEEKRREARDAKLRHMIRPSRSSRRG
jgi:hypothetical protein